MRHPRATCAAVISAAAIAIAFGAAGAGAQAPPGAQKSAPAKPYKVIPVTLPAPFHDPAFEEFRNQLVDIAGRKDRIGLARLVDARFFWLGENGDKADKKKAGIDNLAEAAGLDVADGAGWEALGQVVGNATLEPFSERKGVMCSPAGPSVDQKAAGQVVKSTGTQLYEWGYTTRAGLDVRAAGQPEAPVVEKLVGLHLIRLAPEDAPGASASFVRVITPSGRTGFTDAEFVKTFPESQICYRKDAKGWRIGGLVGG